MINRNWWEKWFFLPMVAIIVLPVLGFAQQQERRIDKESWRNEPIKVLGLKTKDKTIELGKKFSEEDDWLKGLTVTAQNVSDKPIARIEIRLSFPRPGGGSSPETAIYAIAMGYGKEPSEVSPEEALKLILPGERVDIKLLEVNLPFINEDLEKLGYGQPIKHAQITVRSVTFADGSEWTGDEMLYPNPLNPKEKINPKFPIDVQVPRESRSPPKQSKAQCNSSGFGFLNAGLRRAHPPPRLNSRRILLGKFWLSQLPETLPCDRIFVRNQAVSCGPVGEGCAYREDVFIDNPTPDVLWQSQRKEDSRAGAMCSE